MAFSDFARILETTAQKFLKGAADATLRSSILLSKLKAKGRVEGGARGSWCEWRVKGGLRSLTPIVEGQPLTVTRSNNYDHALLNWFGYEVDDVITEKERLMNGGGETQLIDMAGGLMEDMSSDFETGFNAELYKNGETTTNADRIHGVDTWFQISTATLPTGGAGGEQLAVAAHGTLTYGGIKFSATKNSNYYWRPMIVVDANSGAYGAGGFSASNALKIFDDACVKQSQRLGGSKFADLGITTFTWYKFLREALISKESIYIERPSGKIPEYTDDLGFHFIKMNGVPVYPETDWPTQKQGGANGMYLLRTDKIKLRHLGPKFFNFHQEGDIEKGLVTQFLISHYSQLFTDSPYFQCKIVDQA